MHENQLNTHEKQPNRRAVLGALAKLGLLGMAGSVLQASEPRMWRDKRHPPTLLVYKPEVGTFLEQTVPLATLCERGRLSPYVHQVDDSVAAAPYTLQEVPTPTAAVPALVLYSRTHQDHPSENLSPLRRAFIQFKDLVGSDRVMFIITKDPAVVPAVSSPFSDGSTSADMVFFPIQPNQVDSEESFAQILARDFAEFRFSAELITALYTGTARGFWRNFGSSLGHGTLPDVFLVRSNN